MDQWEAVRQLARAKRAQLREKTASVTAEDLLAAADGLCQFKRHGVRADHSLLDGAEAVLDPEMGVIWFNQDKDPTVARVDQAHEYAHFWLDGTAARCTAPDLDPDTTAADGAPAAIERVDGYSPHERRELQANIFAREFLLPAADLRSWYQAEGLTASAIAQRVGLHEGLVHHQLAEALLVPAIVEAAPDETQKEDRSLRLDPSQEQAAHAAPGPGVGGSWPRDG